MKIIFYTILELIIIVFLYSNAYPDWPDYDRALQYYKLAKFDSTIYYANKIVPTDSLYFYAQLLSGHTHLELDSLDKAKNIFESLLDFRHKREFIYNGIGLYYLYKAQKEKGIIKLINKFFSKDDLNKAKDLFSRAMHLNPEYLDAVINFNRVLIETDNKDEIQKALNNLGILGENNPNNLEILDLIGQAREKNGDRSGAIHEYQNILVKNSEYADANIRLAFIYLENEDYPLFSMYYLKGCETLINQRLIRRLLFDIIDILSNQDRQFINNHILDGNFFKYFWLERDPLPLTEENERLIEHYKRLEYARDHYSSADITGYDDRGKIYVRYGKPDDYYRSPSSADFSLETESWVYNIGNETYNFDFVDDGSGFMLTSDLSASITNPNLLMALSDLREMYARRSHLSNYYANIYRELLTLHPSTTAGANTDISGIIHRYAIQEESKRMKIPVSVYSLQLEGTDLKYDFDTFKYFDYDQKKWYVDLFYGLQLNQLPVYFQNNVFNYELEEELLVNSSKYINYQNKKTQNILIVSKNEAANEYYVNKKTKLLEFGLNKLFLQLKTSESKKLRLVEKELNCPRIAEQLQMSDLLFSDDIHLWSTNDDSLFRKKSFYINPIPSRNFLKSRSIYCYFELYNISPGLNNKRIYDIEYRINEFKTGRNLSNLIADINPFSKEKKNINMVAIVNEMEFNSDHESVILSFDVSNLPIGTYEFTVKVSNPENKNSIQEKKLIQLIQ